MATSLKRCAIQFSHNRMRHEPTESEKKTGQLGEAASIVTLIRAATDRYSDRIAFVDSEQRVTYREIGQQANALASFLAEELDVTAGDRVAIMLPNCIPFPISAIGILSCGGVIVNVNPSYTEHELRHQLNDAGAEVLIVYANVLDRIANAISLSRIKSVIVFGGSDVSSMSVPNNVRLIFWSDAVKILRPNVFSSREVNANSIALLQYTGGTTGISKGAILRHRNVSANTAQIRAALALDAGDRPHCVLTALPLYHIFAFTVNFLTLFTIGACNVLVRTPSEIDSVVGALTSHPVTFVTGVNTLFANIIRHPRAREVDWSKLKFAIGGGSAILPTTSEQWFNLTGHHILEGLGMTETSPVLTVNPPGIDYFSGTVGMALPGTEIVIIDRNGSICDVDEPGEICVKGPQVMSGYWGHDGHEDEIFTSDGYFKTGDIGRLNENGFLKLVDRKKDMILVSGFNVYPNEIEAVASEHQAVLECACIGVPDDKTGESVKLFVTVVSRESFAVDEFLSFCRSRLAGYKIPRHIEILDELPKSPVGKILRRMLG